MQRESVEEFCRVGVEACEEASSGAALERKPLRRRKRPRRESAKDCPRGAEDDQKFDPWGA